MLKHFLKVHSSGRVENQTFFNEALRDRIHMNIFRELESTEFNFLIGLLDLGRLERRSAIEHGVKNYTNGPIVNFVAVPIRIFENLGG